MIRRGSQYEEGQVCLSMGVVVSNADGGATIKVVLASEFTGLYPVQAIGVCCIPMHIDPPAPCCYL